MRYDDMVTYDDVDRACTGARKPQPNGFWYACPAHATSKLKLSVLRASDGGAKITCWSGQCDYRAIIEALGIERERPVDKPKPKPKPKAKPAASTPGTTSEWIYVDPDGSPVLKVVRKQLSPTNKTFFQLRPGATKRWSRSF